MKILVGYDGSSQGEDALKIARKHALAFKATVYVVTSLPGDNQTTQEEIEQSKDGLEHARKFFSDSGISVETHLLIRGLSPGEDLVQFAKDNEIDEIVVGLRKTSAVGKLIFGSNARYVMLHSPCPVLSVR